MSATADPNGNVSGFIFSYITLFLLSFLKDFNERLLCIERIFFQREKSLRYLNFAL